MSRMGRPVITDAGYLMAVCDPDSSAHDQAKRRLNYWVGRGQRLFVPASTYCEAMIAAQRTYPHAARALDRFVDEIGFLLTFDRADARSAAKWCATWPALSFRQGLVLGSATMCVAEEILTLDDQLHDMDQRRLGRKSHPAAK
jgi:predicted nucleic acid-binding protein